MSGNFKDEEKSDSDIQSEGDIQSESPDPKGEVLIDFPDKPSVAASGGKSGDAEDVVTPTKQVIYHLI